MPFTLGLIQNCEEYRNAYAAAFPIVLAAARNLPQKRSAEHVQCELSDDTALQQQVLEAITSVSPTNMGRRGWYAANHAHSDAITNAAAEVITPRVLH
jgi:hypothetical protein